MRAVLFAAVTPLLLAGCAHGDTTRDAQALWGPCRSVALLRARDVRDTGYNQEQQNASLFWVYNECVLRDRQFQVHSVYNGPPSRPALPAPSIDTIF